MTKNMLNVKTMYKRLKAGDQMPERIRIYLTTIPADTRRICIMQDRQYRPGVTAASMGYFYPPRIGGTLSP